LAALCSASLIYRSLTSDIKMPSDVSLQKDQAVSMFDDVSDLNENHQTAESPTQRVPTPDDKDVEALEIVVNKNDLREHQDSAKSVFSKSYKLLAEVELSAQKQMVNVNLDEPINNVISVVFVGGQGEVKHQISKVGVNGNFLPKEKSALNGIYFQDDWQKLDLHGNKFTSLNFLGSALAEPGKIKIYLQYQNQGETK